MKTNITASTSAPTVRSRRQTPKQGLPSRPDHQHQHPEAEAASAPAADRPPLPRIDLARRRRHRGFGTEQVLALLQREAPEFFERAEIVGKWVWIEFRDKQPREVTARLAELGFHWNNRRGVWQHPCGHTTDGTDQDPRRKYHAYFPADMRAA